MFNGLFLLMLLSSSFVPTFTYPCVVQPMKSATVVLASLACCLALAYGIALDNDGTSLLEAKATVSLGVPHSVISIPLERWDLPEEKAESIVENIRLRQLHLENPSFLEASAQVGDIKLERQGK